MTTHHLDQRQKVMCYLMNRIEGIPQHHIATMYGTNSGRVSEAITAIEYAVENTELVYNLVTEGKKNGE